MSKIYIMESWAEFNEKADKSMKNDFCSAPYPDMQQIVNYLKNSNIAGIAFKTYKDVFTGETIGPAKIYSDDELLWNSSLPYYIQKYNLRLPEDIEKKILSKISHKNAENTL